MVLETITRCLKEQIMNSLIKCIVNFSNAAFVLCLLTNCGQTIQNNNRVDSEVSVLQAEKLSIVSVLFWKNATTDYQIRFENASYSIKATKYMAAIEGGSVDIKKCSHSNADSNAGSKFLEVKNVLTAALKANSVSTIDPSHAIADSPYEKIAVALPDNKNATFYHDLSPGQDSFSLYIEKLVDECFQEGNVSVSDGL